MARTVTCTLRIASIAKQDNIPLSIAAAIFVAAGVVILYVVNLIFAQRIIRAQHPKLGWHPAFKIFCIAVYVIIVLTLIMLITSVVQSYYTLSNNTHRIDRDIQLYGATAYAIISFLPLPLLTLSLLLPRSHPKAVDKFGAGRFRTKIVVLYIAATLICAGASWRAGTTWVTPVPRFHAVPWYHQKVYFYVFDFTVEVLTVYLYAFLRVDLRFYVPNGAHGPGSYRAGAGKPAVDGASDDDETRARSGINVYTEEETFDFDDRLDTNGAKEKFDLESQSDGVSRPQTAATQGPPGTASTLAPDVNSNHRSEVTLMGSEATHSKEALR